MQTLGFAKRIQISKLGVSCRAKFVRQDVKIRRKTALRYSQYPIYAHKMKELEQFAAMLVQTKRRVLNGVTGRTTPLALSRATGEPWKEQEPAPSQDSAQEELHRPSVVNLFHARKNPTGENGARSDPVALLVEEDNENGAEIVYVELHAKDLHKTQMHVMQEYALRNLMDGVSARELAAQERSSSSIRVVANMPVTPNVSEHSESVIPESVQEQLVTMIPNEDMGRTTHAVNFQQLGREYYWVKRRNNTSGHGWYYF